MVGQAPHRQSCKQAKSSIQSGDDGRSHHRSSPAAGRCKLRNNPVSSRQEARRDALDKRIQFVLKQAIEEEVRHNEVITNMRRNKLADVLPMKGNALAIFRPKSAIKEAKHRRTDIDHVGVYIGICPEQLSQKPPISIAQHKRMLGVVDCR